MKKKEEKFKHPSSISLFNIYDKLYFPAVKGLTLKNVIENKNSFIEWAIVKNKIFCLDDYSYKYLKKSGFQLSETAEKIQLEKRKKFFYDTVEINKKYDPHNVNYKLDPKNVRLYGLEEKISFGVYSEFTINELLEINPIRLEFYIQNLIWFGLTQKAMEKLAWISQNTNNLFLNDTIGYLNLKFILGNSLKANKSPQSKKPNFDNEEAGPAYILGDYRMDEDVNPWIDVFGHGDEANDAYWNTN